MEYCKREMIRRIIRSRIARFFIVGCLNALLHFSVLNFGFYILGLGKIPASILATIFAVSFSFVMNRNFVFRSKKDGALRQVLLFVLVTVTGMLIVHNAVYALALAVIENWDQSIVQYIADISGIQLSEDFVDINLSTVVGAIAAMFWNYNGYKYLVFKEGKIKQESKDEE